MNCSTSNTPMKRNNPGHGFHRLGPKPLVPGRPRFSGSGVLPQDFAQRLDRLRRAANLTWNGFADALGVDRKQVLRWKDGTEPCGGAMLSIFGLAALVPGGLDIIMGDGFLASLERE